MHRLSVLALLGGCPRLDATPATDLPTDMDTVDTEDTGTPPTPHGPVDADQDGWPPDVDCDDTLWGVNPGVQVNFSHLCKGIDFNCDGIAEGDEDFDGDGQSYCELDCDDGDPGRYRGALDPLDGVDQDCDGTDGVGEVPTLVLSGDQEHGSLGTVLAAMDVDGDACTDLLVSDCGLTTRTVVTGSGLTGGSNRIHALLGCQGVQTLRTYSEATTDGIGAILLPLPSVGSATDVLAVSWYTGGDEGVARVLSFAEEPPMLRQTFMGLGNGDMHAAVVLQRSSGADQLLLSSVDSNGSGPGRVWDLPLPDPLLFDTPDMVAWPVLPAEQWGQDILAYDRDGDGNDDFVTSSPSFGATSDGTLYVLTSPGEFDAAAETWQGDMSLGTNFGSELFGAPNIPVPGARSLLGGDVSYFGTGALYLLPSLPGAHTLDDASALFHGEFADEWFGFSAAVGDVNGDGEADLVVGAPYSSLVNDRVGEPGKVYIFLGPLVEEVYAREQARVFVGTQPGSLFGWAVTTADLDSDGTDEIYVGEPQWDGIGVTPSSMGAVYRLDL